MLLNNERVKNEIKEEIKNFLDTNENELTRVQNLWYTTKVVLRGKFIEIQAYLKKIEIFHINNSTSKGTGVGKKPSISRRKQITKIREKLNDIETKRIILRINKSRS